MNEHGLYDQVVRAKAGDNPAVGELFLRTEQELRRYARMLLGANWDDKSSSDLVHDTWKKALPGLAKFRGGPDDRQTAALLRSWLKKIMVNTFKNELRSEERSPRTMSLDVQRTDDSDATDLDPAADTSTPSTRLRRKETRRKVHEVLALLPEDEREVVRLALLEECSYVEIAALLHCDESTVRYRLGKALPRRRALLKELQ